MTNVETYRHDGSANKMSWADILLEQILIAMVSRLDS